MNILLTVHHVLCPDADAGAGGVTLELAAAYRRLGHEAEVYAYDHLPKSMPFNMKRLMFPYFLSRRLHRVPKPYDVVDASSGDAWVWAVSGRGRIRESTALITRSHGLEHLVHQVVKQRARDGLHRLSWKYPLYDGGFHLWEVEQSFRLADGAVFLNQAEQEYGQREFGLKSSAVIGNRITGGYLGRGIGYMPNKATDPLNIAVVGRYEPLKGVVYAADALVRLMRLRSNVRVTFLGTQYPVARVLADYPKDLHPRIGVVTDFAHQELPELLDRFHIKLFPSLKEGTGMALIEAMACGLAPVTTAIPGPANIVADGKNGLLVPPGNADAIYEALDKLAADRQLLVRLRHEAWRSAQHYGWDDIARRTVAYYEECRERKGKRRLPQSG